MEHETPLWQDCAIDMFIFPTIPQIPQYPKYKYIMQILEVIFLPILSGYVL